MSEADPAARAEALQHAKQEAAERHQLRMEEQEKVGRMLGRLPEMCRRCWGRAQLALTWPRHVFPVSCCQHSLAGIAGRGEGAARAATNARWVFQRVG